MNDPIRSNKYPFVASAVAAALVLAACTTTSSRLEDPSAAREKLSRLQADAELAALAPVAVQEAEVAVAAAEERPGDDEEARHRVYLAERKVEIAWAMAEARQAEEQRDLLGDARDGARLDSRTREADAARDDAHFAHSAAEAARTEADIARTEADIARSEADITVGQASGSAQPGAAEDPALEERVLTDLNAEQTERGLVVSLGDVSFEPGSAELTTETSEDLDKLANFLNQNEDRSAVIEGHTDDVGSATANMALSERRAEAVKDYLERQGVSSERLTAAGKGESAPVASNSSASGRQQNRRVEVVISDTLVSGR